MIKSRLGIAEAIQENSSRLHCLPAVGAPFQSAIPAASSDDSLPVALQTIEFFGSEELETHKC